MDNQSQIGLGLKNRLRIKVITNSGNKFVVSALKSQKVKQLYKIIKDVYEEVVNGRGKKVQNSRVEKKQVQVKNIKLGQFDISLHELVGDIIVDFDEIYCDIVQRKPSKSHQQQNRHNKEKPVDINKTIKKQNNNDFDQSQSQQIQRNKKHEKNHHNHDKSKQKQKKSSLISNSKEKKQQSNKNISASNGRPKKPLSAYFVFMNKTRKNISDSYPDLKGNQINSLFTQIWGDLTSQQRAVYEQQSKRLRAQYEKELYHYLKRHPQGMTKGEKRKVKEMDKIMNSSSKKDNKDDSSESQDDKQQKNALQEKLKQVKDKVLSSSRGQKQKKKIKIVQSDNQDS